MKYYDGDKIRRLLNNGNAQSRHQIVSRLTDILAKTPAYYSHENNIY